MINIFKDNEVRDTAVIYKSTFDQIKKLYAVNPQQAGELAISAFELALTGEISSDDFMIGLLLENIKVVNEKQKNRYDKRVEANRESKKEKDKLEMIAELHCQGYSQDRIAKMVGTTQSTISKRLGLIRAEYPELLENYSKNIPKSNNYSNYSKNSFYSCNDNVNDNDNDNIEDGIQSIPPSCSKQGGYRNPISQIVSESTNADGTFRM